MSNKYDNSKNFMPQMSLFGLGTKPDHEHNYFFALSPGPEVCKQLAQAADDLNAANAFNGSWISSECYHLPLHKLGQFPEVRADLASRAMSVANNIQAAAFDIRFDQFVSFDSKTGKFPCVLTSSLELPELQNFWQHLKNNLFAVKLGQYVASNFQPHVVLLHNRQPIQQQTLIAPIQWRVIDFVLIESLVGKSQHVELGRWPLSN